MNLYQKILQVRKSIPYLQKLADGHNYKYVDGATVLGSIKAKMYELGIILYPSIGGHKIEPITYKNSKGYDKTEFWLDGDLSFIWVDADSGETLNVPFAFTGMQDDPSKAFGSALTYAERYFLLKFFNIATDKDDPDAFERKIDKVTGEDKLKELKERIQKGMDALKEKHTPQELKEIIFDQLGMSLDMSSDQKSLDKLLKSFQEMYKATPKEPVKEPIVIDKGEIDLTVALNELAMRKFGSAQERQLMLESIMQAKTEQELNVIMGQLLSRPVVAEMKVPEVIETTEQASNLASDSKSLAVEELQQVIISKLKHMQTNKIDKFDTSVRLKNSVKQHLSVEKVQDCTDIDKLAKYVSLLEKKIRGEE